MPTAFRQRPGCAIWSNHWLMSEWVRLQVSAGPRRSAETGERLRVTFLMRSLSPKCFCTGFHGVAHSRCAERCYSKRVCSSDGLVLLPRTRVLMASCGLRAYVSRSCHEQRKSTPRLPICRVLIIYYYC